MFSELFKINLIILFITTLCCAEIVNNIEVNGNKRLSRESIIVFTKIEESKNYSDKDLNEALKNLYNTNFFKKIDLKINNNVLYIDVVENPIIESLVINGIKKSSIEEFLLDVMELKSRKSYTETAFKKDLYLMKNVLKKNGFYFADVKTSIEKNLEQNSVILTYDVDLGKRAKIGEIVFLGDKKIKDRKLRNVIVSEEAKLWKFLSNNTNLDDQRIKLDKRLLLNYYRNFGYYSVDIEDSFVEFRNDGSFKLIFNINAGELFTFNKLTLITPTDYKLVHFEEINKTLSKLENKEYSLERIEKILDKIDNIALSKQYEFINADIEEEIVENNKLNISFIISETEKFYVERINILGNQITLEEVIRNSLIVDEGDPYNEILFNKSINNLKAKNIFGSVTSEIKDGKNANMKIIDIEIEEKPTGEISLGAGVGTTGGTIGGGIKENNFLGKGIKLDTNVSIAKNTLKGQFIYARPNFNYSDNTLFTSIQSTTTDNLTDFGYKTQDLGFSLGTTFQQYEDFFYSPEIDIAFEELTTTSTASKNLKKQEGNYFDLYYNHSVSYDLRDRRYQATDGHNTFFSQKLPMASEKYEISNQLVHTRYKKLVGQMVTKVSFYGKTINALKDEDVRISKRLYLPANRLRGFEAGKVGPIDTNDFIGGNYASAVNVSTTLPKLFPTIQNADFSLFFDAGNVWGVDYDSSVDNNSTIRSATGITLDIITPVGPMNFSLAQPITKQSSDITETFRFNIGTTF